MKLNTMMENEHERLTNISIFSEIKFADRGICDHDVRRGIKIIVELWFFYVIGFNMMNFLG